MEPVEINAGTVYLRQFRDDDKIDDRPALIEAFADPATKRFVPQYVIETFNDASAYVRARALGWREQTRCTWAIAEPTTGACRGEVALKQFTESSAEIAVWTHPDVRQRGFALAAVDAVTRYGFGALGLDRVDYVCEDANTASIALARRAGFTFDGPMTSLCGQPSQRWVRKGS